MKVEGRDRRRAPAATAPNRIYPATSGLDLSALLIHKLWSTAAPMRGPPRPCIFSPLSLRCSGDDGIADRRGTIRGVLALIEVARCSGIAPYRLPLTEATQGPTEMHVRLIQLVVGLGCTLFFLAIALYRVNLSAVSAALASADPVWIGAAMLVYTGNLALRAWRWQVILRPVATIPYPLVARALLVGYGLNAVMPARLGELFRAEFFKKTSGVSRIWGLTSIVIERLFDGVTVICCLGVGLLFAATTRPNAGLLVNLLVTGTALFGTILLATVYLSGGSTLSRIVRLFPGLSARIAIVQQGFEILRTWRTLKVITLTLVIYIPDAFSLWCLVKAVGLRLGFSDILVLLGAASLSTLLPSGPAFLGTLQFAYGLAVEFATGTRALGIAAATLAQLCLLLPLALIGAGILVHGSRTILYDVVARRQSDDERASQ